MNLRGMTPGLKLMRWKAVPDESAEDWERRLKLEGQMLREAWGVFLGRIPWESSVTLTFDPKRSKFDVSREKASREAFKWLGVASYSLGRPLAWVYATERQASGRWHAHTAIAGASCDDIEGSAAIWRKRFGIANVEPVSYGHGAIRYIAKEAAEEGELILSDTVIRYREFLVSEAPRPSRPAQSCAPCRAI